MTPPSPPNWLEEKLVKRFPSWFSVNGDVRHTPMPFGFEHGDGWFNILWRLCADLEPLVAELEKETGERFEVVQAKQKLGTVVGQFARSDASSMWLFARAKGATAGSLRVGQSRRTTPSFQCTSGAAGERVTQLLGMGVELSKPSPPTSRLKICAASQSSNSDWRATRSMLAWLRRRLHFRSVHGAILLLAIVRMCAAQQSSDFDGTWVLRLNGQNIFKLTLATERGLDTGSLTKPKKLTFDQDGDVTDIGPDQVTLPVQKSKLGSGQLELTIDGDRFVMTLGGHNRALLVLEDMRPWKLERVSDGSAVIIASSLPEPHYPEEIRALREQLRAMVKEEQDARLAFDEARIEAADAKNRPEVLRIFSKYGWVTNSLAGKDAAHDFWLLIQHQTPEIQRRLLPPLEKAAKTGNASMSDYAYLYDRVQVDLDKPQHWGTQTKCEDGKPVLSPVDDPAGLDARRKELFMRPIHEYLKSDYLTKDCARAGKQPVTIRACSRASGSQLRKVRCGDCGRLTR